MIEIREDYYYYRERPNGFIDSSHSDLFLIIRHEYHVLFFSSRFFEFTLDWNENG